MISMDKQYRTRDGREVRIYAVDGGGKYPIHGAIFIDGKWYAETWNTFGKVCEDMDEDYDLIEVKPRIKRKYWVNVYKSGQNFHPTKKDADAVAGNDPDRIACIERFIDCEEGEGL